MPLVKRSLSKPAPVKNSKLDALRKLVEEFPDVKEAASDANNALNRFKTKIKNAIFEYLEGNGATRNDAIVLGDNTVSYRPNITEEIDPRVWHRLYIEKKISDNQYFRAISISVDEAKKAIGEDQIPEVVIKTLTKTPDLRLLRNESGAENKPGDILPFQGSSIPTAKEAKERAVEQVVGTPPVAVRKKLKIKLGR